MSNFDLRKYLVENKLTAGSRLNEETQNGTTYLTIKEPLTKAMAAIGYKKTIVGKSEFSPLSFARPLNTKSVLEVRVSPATDKGEIVISKGVGEEESKVDYPVIMFLMYPNSIENPSPPQESTNFIVRPTYIDLSKYTTEEAVNKITRLVKEFDNETNINEDMGSPSEKKSMLLSKLKSLVPGKEKAFLEFMGEAADNSQDYSEYSMDELLDMFIDFEENENGEEFTSEIADEVLTMYVRGFKRFLKTGEIEF